MKAAAAVALVVWSWALVVAAEARHQAEIPRETVRVVYVEVEVERERVPKPTPYADSLVDFDEVERDTQCLWVILQEHFGWEITMDRVTAAALWTHELGGACAVIGEDDVQEED